MSKIKTSKNIRNNKQPSYPKDKAAKNNDIIVAIKTHNDKKGGHPHIIIEDIDDNHISVGLSTQPKKGKNGGLNYKMGKNPLNNGKQSYMRRQGTVAPKSEYTGKRNGSLTPKDYKQAKIYGERAKQKYLNKKKGKKK